MVTGFSVGAGPAASSACSGPGSAGSVTRKATPAISTAAALISASGEDMTKPSSALSRPRRERRSAAATDTRWRSGISDLEPEAARGARPLARRTEATESTDEQGVVGQRGRAVDQGVEHLVVARRRHLELVA